MTNQTLKNPSVVLIPNPVGLDKAIQRVQLRLGTIPWLEKSFGRAWTMPRTVSGATGGVEKRIEPMVFQGDGLEYYPVLPNDALKSYSFFRSNKARVLDVYEPSTAYGQFPMTDAVDLIFWFNMKAIDPDKVYIIKEELLKDVLNSLNGVNNVWVKTVWDDKVEDIFSGYTLFPNHRDLLMYPFGAFRLELSIRYEFNCQ